MYENEIKELESIKRCYPVQTERVDTAIAIMRAASVSPGNETAELAHCEIVADAVPGVGSWDTRIAIRGAILDQRAAVRAECADEIKFLRECGGGMRTEIERLRAEVSMYEKQRSMGTYEGSALMAELAARKAAGAPKDEAAEHVFLRNMSNEWGIPLGVIAGWREGARRRARAECAVETQAAREKANADAHAYADEFKVKPLQAEIERLKAQLSGVGMQEFRRLEGRLHNAQAEIERLKSLSDGLARAAATLVADNSTLQTELTEQAAEIERLKVQLQEQRAANTESHEADYQEGYENGWAEGLGMEVK